MLQTLGFSQNKYIKNIHHSLPFSLKMKLPSKKKQKEDNISFINGRE